MRGWDMVGPTLYHKQVVIVKKGDTHSYVVKRYLRYSTFNYFTH